MRNPVHAILMGAALGLAICSVSHAKSELVSMTVQPEWPAQSEPCAAVSYKVTVMRAGQGLLEVALSCQGLPEGMTASFSPNCLRFTGRVPQSLTTTLTIKCASAPPTDDCPFTVTGRSRREIITQTAIFPGGLPDASLLPPRLALERLQAGGLLIRGTGASGRTYQIEASSDLSHSVWTKIGSSTADGDGRFTFIEAVAKDAPMRFFRAFYPGLAQPPPQ
jgi:hypothetical protein